MNRIVVYTSKTGFTATYAKWIAEELQCQVKPLKDIDVKSLKEYDQVIYGGWIMGGMISGLNKILKEDIKELIVFGSGMSAQCDGIRELVLKQNNVEPEKFFYFEGGYAPDKVGFIGNMMIKMVTGSVRKKEIKTEDELRMLETAKGADRTDKAMIRPLIEYIK